MNEEEIKRLIGNIGEEIVHQYHPNSERSDDWFDDCKDLMIDSLKCEIKTITKIIKFNEFWIDAKQEKKIKGVDILFIVEIPMYIREINVYICPNNKLLRVVKRQRRNEYVDVLAVPESKLYKLFSLTNDPRIDQLIELSDELSSFRRNTRHFRSEL